MSAGCSVYANACLPTADRLCERWVYLAIGRKNLEWILSGHPDAVPLFKPKSRNWAAKLTKFMPHFLLANRTSEKLVEANVRGC